MQTDPISDSPSLIHLGGCLASLDARSFGSTMNLIVTASQGYVGLFAAGLAGGILLLVHVKFLIRRVDKRLHTAFLGSDS